MCNLSDAIEQQGIVKGDKIGYKRGIEEGYDAQARMVEKLMKMMNLSLEEVFTKFELSDTERNEIRHRLQPEV